MYLGHIFYHVYNDNGRVAQSLKTINLLAHIVHLFWDNLVTQVSNRDPPGLLVLHLRYIDTK